MPATYFTAELFVTALGTQGAATYGGYLTWDDHPVSHKKAKKDKTLVMVLNHCRPFGCVSNLE